MLSDTHMPRRAAWLPKKLERAIDGADAIVHLGDFTDPDVADALEGKGRLYAVQGNNDPVEIRGRYPIRQDITINGHHVVLIHGHRGGRNARAAARSIRGADVVLYGHSHIPSVERDGDTILFNPGSPTDRRQAPITSFGILEIGAAIDARIVPVDEMI